MKKAKKVINVFTGHTLEEYKSLYDIDKSIHIDKETINKFYKKHPKAKKNVLLDGRSWWLIDDTYYEINLRLVRPLKVKKNKSGLKIAIASIIGAIAIAGVAIGGYLIIKQAWNSSSEQLLEPTSTDNTSKDIAIECTVKVKNTNHINLTCCN